LKEFLRKRVLLSLPSGGDGYCQKQTVITVAHQEHVHGMTANAFMSVSLKPPLVLVSIGINAQMYKLLAPGVCYGVSMLSDDQEVLSRHFGAARWTDLHSRLGKSMALH
jgi:flavin reductase (DIM6/NTAB) family NADH-FMN oxidoreductase RutF